MGGRQAGSKNVVVHVCCVFSVHTLLYRGSIVVIFIATGHKNGEGALIRQESCSILNPFLNKHFQ